MERNSQKQWEKYIALYSIEIFCELASKMETETMNQTFRQSVRLNTASG